MEVEFQHVQKWSATNKLQINMTKTKELVFRQLGLSARYFTSPQPLPFIEQVKVTKLVEVYITVTFFAVTHIKHILSVANQRMYLLAQLKSQGLSVDCFSNRWTTLVHLVHSPLHQGPRQRLSTAGALWCVTVRYKLKLKRKRNR